MPTYRLKGFQRLALPGIATLAFALAVDETSPFRILKIAC